VSLQTITTDSYQRKRWAQSEVIAARISPTTIRIALTHVRRDFRQEREKWIPIIAAAWFFMHRRRDEALSQS
jgi:hypothetical protein